MAHVKGTDTRLVVTCMHTHRVPLSQTRTRWPMDCPQHKPVHTLNDVLPHKHGLAPLGLGHGPFRGQGDPGVAVGAPEEVGVQFVAKLGGGADLLWVNKHACRGSAVRVCQGGLEAQVAGEFHQGTTAGGRASVGPIHEDGTDEVEDAPNRFSGGLGEIPEAGTAPHQLPSGVE